MIEVFLIILPNEITRAVQIYMFVIEVFEKIIQIFQKATRRNVARGPLTKPTVFPKRIPYLL